VRTDTANAKGAGGLGTRARTARRQACSKSSAVRPARRDRQHGLARGFGTYDDIMGVQGIRLETLAPRLAYGWSPLLGLCSRSTRRRARPDRCRPGAVPGIPPAPPCRTALAPQIEGNRETL